MSKYHVSQIQNGMTITYGDFNTDNTKEAVKMACGVAKEKYPQYSRKIPFKVKKYGGNVEEVKYNG
jgi:hypothetical protein